MAIFKAGFEQPLIQKFVALADCQKETVAFRSTIVDDRELTDFVFLNAKLGQKKITISFLRSIIKPGLGNLSTKNRGRDRFSGLKYRQATGQRF